MWLLVEIWMPVSNCCDHATREFAVQTCLASFTDRCANKFWIRKPKIFSVRIQQLQIQIDKSDWHWQKYSNTKTQACHIRTDRKTKLHPKHYTFELIKFALASYHITQYACQLVYERWDWSARTRCHQVRPYQLRNAQNNFPNSVFCITHISLE